MKKEKLSELSAEELGAKLKSAKTTQPAVMQITLFQVTKKD